MVQSIVTTFECLKDPEGKGYISLGYIATFMPAFGYWKKSSVIPIINGNDLLGKITTGELRICQTALYRTL